MAKLALKALAAALLFATPLHAQQARVVTACGSLAPFGPNAPGGLAYPTVDVTGKLCLSGGGGGGAITAGTTTTTGFNAGQLLMSDGAKVQGSGNPETPLEVGPSMWLLPPAYLGSGWLGFSTTPNSSGLGTAIQASAGIVEAFQGFAFGAYPVTQNAMLLGILGTNTAAFFNWGAPGTPVGFRLNNAYTDNNNGEWGGLDWLTTPNTLTIGAQKNGTGTLRGINLVGASVKINGTAAVNCAAGTVSATTMVVTNGIITHC